MSLLIGMLAEMAKLIIAAGVHAGELPVGVNCIRIEFLRHLTDRQVENISGSSDGFTNSERIRVVMLFVFCQTIKG